MKKIRPGFLVGTATQLVILPPYIPRIGQVVGGILLLRYLLYDKVGVCYHCICVGRYELNCIHRTSQETLFRGSNVLFVAKRCDGSLCRSYRK